MICLESMIKSGEHKIKLLCLRVETFSIQIPQPSNVTPFLKDQKAEILIL